MHVAFHRNKNASAVTARHFDGITMKPTEFPAYLLSEEVGFASMVDAGTPEGVSRGFRRPVHVYIK